MMNQTYTKIAEQTGYFKSQTALLSQQMEGYMAAVVQSQIQYDQGGNGLFLQVINTGHVLSPKVVVDLSIYRHSYPVPSGTKPFKHFHEEITQLPVTPSNNGTVRFDDGYMFKIAPPWKEQFPYVVEGTVTFGTGFNAHVLSQSVCYANANLPGFKMVNGVTSGLGIVECRSYRNAVWNYLEFKKRSEVQP